MGALEKARNRSIDSLWEVNAKTIMALEATLGVAIGSDDGRVIYIQDTGVKEVGRGYIDRATKKVHICKERTEDVINTSAKFEDISVDTINNKLQNLLDYNKIQITIGGIPVRIERFGKICILYVASETPNANFTQITTGIPNWALPISETGGALTGDGRPEVASGEMYIYPSGILNIYVTRIDAQSLYTGQIIYIAKN